MNICIIQRCLKKEAKDLLKHIKNSTAEAIERVEQYPQIKRQTIKLADTQFIIAREQGLPSWAKLKYHIESINHASQQMNGSKPSPDAKYKTLHIRCGNDIEKALLASGFKGDFLEVSNPFAQGQVPHFEPLEHFVTIRKNFLTKHYQGYVPDERMQRTESEIRQTEEVLRHACKRYQRIVLWYEHDAFDQLSKAYVLAHLAESPSEKTIIECVQIDGFPGIKKFIGLGQLSRMPEAILTLWAQRKPITTSMIAYGAKSWHAFINDNPNDLWHLIQTPNASLPDMPHALTRTLMELPWIGNGLSLTEQLVLDILSTEGEMRPAAIFNLLIAESDPQPYLGDIMLLAILRPLWESDQPAINIVETYEDENPMQQMTLAITHVGKELLANQRNWLCHSEHSATDRYVGGIHIASHQANWYWDPDKHQPVYQ